MDSKIKKFIYKGQYLDVELNETNELYEVYNNIFKKDFSTELDYVRKRSQKLEQENNDENNKDIDNDERPVSNDKEDDENLNTEENENLEEEEVDNDIDLEHKLMKNLYRKITLKTHPDKTNDEELHEIFKQADIAYKEENLLDLLIISIQLRIKYSIMNFNIISKLEKDIKSKEYKINEIKKTIAWTWGTKNDEPQEREKLKKYLYGVWGLPDDFLEKNM